jgi:hypothetical protein
VYSTPADQVDTTIVSRGGALTTVVAGGNPFSFTQGDYKNWADVTLPTSGFELIVEAKMPNDFYVGLHNVAVPTSPHGVQICAGTFQIIHSHFPLHVDIMQLFLFRLLGKFTKWRLAEPQFHCRFVFPRA